MTARVAAHPAAALPLLLSAIPSLPRPVLARLVARMIDRLDDLDGDPDDERVGDEADTSWPESRGAGPTLLTSAHDHEDAEEDDHSGDGLERGELDDAGPGEFCDRDAHRDHV